MWIIGCCKLPYEEFKEDQMGLQFNIAVEGLRPKISEYKNLCGTYEKIDPKKTPKASELRKIFYLFI